MMLCTFAVSGSVAPRYALPRTRASVRLKPDATEEPVASAFRRTFNGAWYVSSISARYVSSPWAAGVDCSPLKQRGHQAEADGKSTSAAGTPCTPELTADRTPYSCS